MINSSADQPIGYPIYVSPLTTSFVETHQQASSLTINHLSFCSLWTLVCGVFAFLRAHVGTTGSSNMGGGGAGGLATSTIQAVGPAVGAVGSTPLPIRKHTRMGSQSSSIGQRVGVGVGASSGVTVPVKIAEREPATKREQYCKHGMSHSANVSSNGESETSLRNRSASFNGCEEKM